MNRTLLLALSLLLLSCGPGADDDNTPTPTATAQPTATPTQNPTPTATPSPSDTATLTPSPSATPSPTGTPVAEICGNGLDDNGDGDFDCQDLGCQASDPLCFASGAETGPSACTDSTDNDGNGFIDCLDWSCQFDPVMEAFCGPEENTDAECSDGVDNDGDTFIDCADFSCHYDNNPTTTVCLTYEATEATCSDGVDNDGNTSVDCADPSCSLAIVCGGAGLPENTDALCSDTVDNDGDGAVDCVDPDCFAAPICIPTGVIFNEILADPPGSLATDLAGDANCDGARSSGEDEFLELVNTDTIAVDISGATLSDGFTTRHTFAANTVLQPGQTLLLFGGGTPSFSGASTNPGAWCTTLTPPGVTVLVADSGTLGLNNSGDTITLLDADGVTVIAVQSYGSEGGNNQSLVRSPDLTGGAWVQHSTVPNSIGAFSPGTRTNGSAL